MKLIVTAEAERDLRTIGRWIAQDNPQRAITFVRELRRACLRLKEFPEKHPLLARQSTSGLRRQVHGNYLIFYRIGIDGIEVIHILHGASDYESLLF